MLKTDKDALICDLAETYGIYDMGLLPVKTVAALAFGLGDGSRSKLALRGERYPLETILLAVIADGVNYIRWSKTQAAADNPNNPPDRFLNDMLGVPQPGDSDRCRTFKTAADFEAARKKILRS